MPQLDTVFIFMTYLWTWLLLNLITQKIKTLVMTSTPIIYPSPNKPTSMPQWL